MANVLLIKKEDPAYWDTRSLRFSIGLRFRLLTGSCAYTRRFSCRFISLLFFQSFKVAASR